MKAVHHWDDKGWSNAGRIPLLFVIVVLILAGCRSDSGSTSKSASKEAHGEHAAANTPASQARVRPPGSAPTPNIPAYFESAEQAKPFPAVLDPKQFLNPVVAKAYAQAQQNPGLYAQQPCYCYCDGGNGHRSLLDCFATDHSAG